MPGPVKPRILSDRFEQDLLSGMLKPMRCLVLRDRDLIAEIRSDCLDIYCKGNRLLGITPTGQGVYCFESHPRFWAKKKLEVHNVSEVTDFCKKDIPFIKQEIAEHSPRGREVEFEQMLIRANNLEALNTDYVAVDRQGTVEDGRDRTDVVGVFWPGDRRRHDKTLVPALIEVKYGLTGGIEGLAGQIKRYFNSLSLTLPDFVEGLQGQLRQKARLGLLSGLSHDAQRKIERLPISSMVGDLRVVIALIDYNPRASRLDINALQKLPFADQIDVFELGLGMWKRKSIFRSRSEDIDHSSCEPPEALAQRQLAGLAQFADAFSSPGFVFGQWSKSDLNADGVAEFPAYCLSPEGRSFYRAVHELGWMAQFQWSAWMDTPEAKALFANPVAVAVATVKDLRRMLTVLVRHDRFHAGTLGDAFDRGILTAIVRRARVLLTEQNSEQAGLPPPLLGYMDEATALLHDIEGPEAVAEVEAAARANNPAHLGNMTQPLQRSIHDEENGTDQ